MLRCLNLFGTPLLLLVLVGGCAQGPEDTSLSEIDTSKYLLDEEPEGAIGVINAREDAQDQEDIVLVARIGGRDNPWIEGRAAFMVIDASLTVVEDGTEANETEICLEDCCASVRASCTTLVKVVDEKGSPLAFDARKLFGLTSDDTVVVKGKVNRDKKQGTFAIAASGIYVRR